MDKLGGWQQEEEDHVTVLEGLALVASVVAALEEELVLESLVLMQATLAAVAAEVLQQEEAKTYLVVTDLLD
jgi:hypothetical protein